MTSSVSSTAPRAVLTGELARLVTYSPAGDARLTALVRRTCAAALSLPPLLVEDDVEAVTDSEKVVVEFAEQFSTDVSTVTTELRGRFFAAVGRKAFTVCALAFIADFVPRVRSGFDALGVDWPAADSGWDHAEDPGDALLNVFAPAVGRLRGLDPVTTEIIRLRGAGQHNCRLCRSRREVAALDAGGGESLYADIERFETSELLSERHKAALRYVDALIWSPARIGADIAAGVHAHFSDDEAIELTLDVMRNATNKIAVALGGDEPRVSDGVEHYLLDADGQVQDA
ncbi:carboxymuconolactone decarboxylase family protein [Mycolicibacterium komossense]|uniref:Carboxymuconolactone decarboxylase family protein n=1 Tax=Mycolicibacterium komossense TaxID=1779 RepID=A0ABT3C604_9MYCO|nr:carboxymuconolactone decarboxylase family protein [Mycolicibacterium komossense]MCV7224908.1 carboxymuconolactone decarboxylase family protein [Mycolicibacterium komossense]